MLSHRRRLGAADGSHKRGRCLTSLLALRLPGADPGVVLPRLCITQWLDCWLREPRLRPSIRSAWSRTVDRLRLVPAGQRSRHVRGP
eukprot:5968447-Pyramimonas_sp.AAC.1